MSRTPHVCYWRRLGPLTGQPCRTVERYPLAITTVVEFPSGEVRRVPAQTVRSPRHKRRAGR